jgi:hypothetical protein
MPYTAVEEQAARQIDDAIVTYDKYCACVLEKEKYRHDMRWVKDVDGDHLHRVDTGSGKLLKDFGLRSDQLVDLHRSYQLQKDAALKNLQILETARAKAERRNLAAGAGRVPNIVVDILHALERHGLTEHYLVIGTHALYAYEAAAKVNFDQPTMATNDVDLLWDVQKRIAFGELMDAAQLSMVEVLQTADPTFTRMEDQKESVMNGSGFYVDFLRRKEPGQPSPAICITNKEGDVYPVQAERSQEFLNSPRFEQVIVDLGGRMARMRTIDPHTFVDFKRWMSEQPGRDLPKRQRDRRQAEAVEQLLAAGLLTSKQST